MNELTATHTLIVFDTDGGTVGEWKYTFPYGNHEAAIEPLKKLKAEFVGVILSAVGVKARSAELPKDNPYWRKGSEVVERV